MVIKFRSRAEHEDILKKVKKMKKFAEELEDCLEEVMEDDDEFEYRGGNYRKEYDEEMEMRGGRYGYRRGGGSRRM